MIHVQRLDFLPLVRLYVDMPEVLQPRELAGDLALILREMEDDCAREQRAVSIIDLSGAPLLDAKQRAIVGAWLKQTRQLSQRISLGSVFIAPSSLVRGVLTAIFWLQSFGIPHAVAANMNDAVAWSLDRMREAGVAVEANAQQRALQAFARPPSRRTA